MPNSGHSSTISCGLSKNKQDNLSCLLMQRGPDFLSDSGASSVLVAMRLKICLRPRSCRAITTLRLVGRWCCSCEMARGLHVFHYSYSVLICQELFENYFECLRWRMMVASPIKKESSIHGSLPVAYHGPRS